MIAMPMNDRISRILGPEFALASSSTVSSDRPYTHQHGLDIEETKPTRGMIAFCLWTPRPVSGQGRWMRVQRLQFELHGVNVLDESRV